MNLQLAMTFISRIYPYRQLLQHRCPLLFSLPPNPANQMIAYVSQPPIVSMMCSRELQDIPTYIESIVVVMISRIVTDRPGSRTIPDTAIPGHRTSEPWIRLLLNSLRSIRNPPIRLLPIRHQILLLYHLISLRNGLLFSQSMA